MLNKMFNHFKKWFFTNVLRARWVVNNDGELGLRIMGQNLWYYKWPEPMVETTGTDDEGYWQFANKREFGETVKSRKNK